jgi:putative DNA primase/helicase
VNSIQDAMAAAGLSPHKSLDLPADGKLHRYRVTGDKGGSNNGWAVLHDGPQPFGASGLGKSALCLTCG